jgi:hypothetical protein
MCLGSPAFFQFASVGTAPRSAVSHRPVVARKRRNIRRAVQTVFARRGDVRPTSASTNARMTAGVQAEMTSPCATTKRTSAGP